MSPSRTLRAGSHLEKVLASGAFGVTAEITAKASGSPDGVLAQARALRGHVDACNVTDAPRARVGIAGLAACALVLREGVEPVLQITTRDRNRIALQADLLGAHALGVRNVVCLHGDDVQAGNEPNAAPVHEFTTEELLTVAKRLRDEGLLAGGDAVEDPPAFFLGATASPFGGSPVDSVVNLRGKVDAGADFVQTQAVFDLDAFEEWIGLVRKEWLHEKVYVLAGVVPLKSARAAKVLGRVPGIVVPPGLVDRLSKASDPGMEGAKVALETLDGLRKVEGIHGVHLMAVGWDDVIPKVVTEAGLLPRPEL